MVVRSVSTMEEGDRVRGSAGESSCRGWVAIVGIFSWETSLKVTGVGEVGVSGRSCGESGEKEGKEVRDLSDGAMEEAELEGWEASLALLLPVYNMVDLCELLDRADC